MAKLKLLRPSIPQPINQEFGENLNSYYATIGLLGHNGIDFGCPSDSKIYASHDGTVTFSGEDGGGGYGVVIRTDQTFDYKDGQALFKTIFWHLRKDGIQVKAGQKVKAGDFIALSDNTGMSSGAHLHWGLKPVYQGEADWQYYNLEQANGFLGAIDPLPYMVESFYVDMEAGSTDPESSFYVVRLQKFLGVIQTGFYGTLTKKAVLDFQIKNVPLSWYERYILRGSKVGPKTRAALNRLSVQNE